MADEPTFWDKVKNYIGIGLTTTEETAKKVGKALKKAGREPDTDINDLVSKPFRQASNGKPIPKKKK